MSEETQVKVVEDENPSAAEKETKVLKKMGANIGEETITKVDLRKPKEEPSKEEVTKNSESNPNEETLEKSETKAEESAEESLKEEPIIEEVKEETKEETKKEKESKTVEQKQQKVAENQEPEMDIPEGILDLIDFINNTGGSMEDYVKLNKDYSKFENQDLIKEYYSTSKPHLNSEEIDFLIQDNYSFDNEIDDPTEIKRKELAFKEETAKAKSFLEDQKQKYYKEVKTTGNLSKEQQKAVDFFNRYNTEQQEIAQEQEKERTDFKLKTNNVFNQEFKGFDFSVDDKKYKYKVKDVDKVKNTQMNIMDVIGSYFN